MSGALDPATVTDANVTLSNGADVVGSAVSLSADGRTLSLVATKRLGFGTADAFAATVKDTLGRTVQMNIAFTTTAMVCADNAIWSNPANFSTVYQDCAAGIGVQVKVDQTYNKVQDDTCTLTLGAPLSAACKAYLANGTMLLANTSIVANSHLVTWMAYVGSDGKSNLVLLDTNDPANASPAPVALVTLPSPLSRLTGNVTGASVRTADGKTSQASLDTANNISITCLAGC